MARFLSLDPLAADYVSWSAYNYMLGNPVMLIDPDGQSPIALNANDPSARPDFDFHYIGGGGNDGGGKGNGGGNNGGGVESSLSNGQVVEVTATRLYRTGHGTSSERLVESGELYSIAQSWAKGGDRSGEDAHEKLMQGYYGHDLGVDYMRHSKENSNLYQVGGEFAMGIAMAPGFVIGGPSMVGFADDALRFSFNAGKGLPGTARAIYQATGTTIRTGFSRFNNATGGLKQWVRIGNSYSKAGGFHTYGVRWGSGGWHWKKIGNSTLQQLNKAFRQTKLPFGGWRSADPGHFHFWKMPK